MRKYFKKDKKPKDEVTIEIKDEIKYEDIKDVFEEVDANGEEIPMDIKDKTEKEKETNNEENKEEKKEAKRRGKRKKKH